MYLNVFKYRMRHDADMEAYQQLAIQMYMLVSSEPRYGFLGMEDLPTSPSEGVVIEQFETREGAVAWARNAEHRRVMARGMREFYAWYQGWGCEVDHDYSHPHPVTAPS